MCVVEPFFCNEEDEQNFFNDWIESITSKPTKRPKKKDKKNKVSFEAKLWDIQLKWV